MLKQNAIGAAQRRAEEKCGRKNAARCARAESERSGEKFEREKEQEQPERVKRAGEDVLDRGVAHTFNLVGPGLTEERIHEDADQEHAARMAQVGIANFLVEKIFEGVDRPDVNDRDQTDHQTQPDIGDEEERMGEMKVADPQLRNGEGRVRSKEKAAHVAGAGRRDRHGHEGPDADFVEQKFRCEKYSADRRVERRGDAGAGAGCDQRGALPCWDAQPLADARTESRTDLNDRTLATDRSAAANRERGGERFNHGDDGSNDAFVVIDCVHHFRHAVAPRFRCESLYQPGDTNPADDRHENNQRSPRTGRRVDVGFVKKEIFPRKNRLWRNAIIPRKTHAPHPPTNPISIASSQKHRGESAAFFGGLPSFGRDNGTGASMCCSATREIFRGRHLARAVQKHTPMIERPQLSSMNELAVI